MKKLSLHLLADTVKDYQDIPRMNITVAGVGYVGLSLAVLLA